MRHCNIPIFVPHLGCPHTCVFCNQRTITGQKAFSVDTVCKTIEQQLATLPPDAEKEIAFFGGSFTAIDHTLMQTLLSLAEHYVRLGEVASIRLSTRPDAIDREILSLLGQYSVKTIELGIQSSDDTVLSLSERGHTAAQAETASRLIKEHGFSLVGQMMLGLPGSTEELEIQTAQSMLRWGIDAARIYPTVVFPETALYKMAKNRSYRPLSVTEAATRCAAVLECFYAANIPVIRIGLCETEGLREEKNLHGAYHPALGELCLNQYYLRVILRELSRLSPAPHETVVIEVAPSALSQALGQKKSNLLTLKTLYPNRKFLFTPSQKLCGKEVKLYSKEN